MSHSLHSSLLSRLRAYFSVRRYSEGHVARVEEAEDGDEDVGEEAGAFSDDGHSEEDDDEVG